MILTPKITLASPKPFISNLDLRNNLALETISMDVCRNRDHDEGAIKKERKKRVWKEIWSRHHNYLWNTMENHKDKASLLKTIFLGSGVGYA